jgi:hypothetical protein
MNSSWAFKNLLKDAFQTQTAPASAPATQAAPASTGPVQYAFDKYGYKFELPGRWKQQMADATGSDVMFFDEQGNKGSFQVHANWMASDFPIAASLQAMAKSYEERVKHDELEKYYRKDFTVKDKSGKSSSIFQGYVTIEKTGADKDIRRMQWIGYAKGNYINFTWASKPEQFESYRPEFEKILNAIQFM